MMMMTSGGLGRESPAIPPSNLAIDFSSPLQRRNKREIFGPRLGHYHTWHLD